MAGNTLQDMIKSGELQWVLYLSIGTAGGGILLIALSLLFFPGPALLVGILFAVVGISLFKYIFDRQGGIRRRGIPRAIRLEVWRKYNGNTLNGKCFVCDDRLTIENFQVGHDTAKAEGGADDISNLRPICSKCNSAMGTTSIRAYKRKYYSNSQYERKPTRRRPTKRN